MQKLFVHFLLGYLLSLLSLCCEGMTDIQKLPSAYHSFVPTERFSESIAPVHHVLPVPVSRQSPDKTFLQFNLPEGLYFPEGNSNNDHSVGRQVLSLSSLPRVTTLCSVAQDCRSLLLLAAGTAMETFYSLRSTAYSLLTIFQKLIKPKELTVGSSEPKQARIIVQALGKPPLPLPDPFPLLEYLTPDKSTAHLIVPVLPGRFRIVVVPREYLEQEKILSVVNIQPFDEFAGLLASPPKASDRSLSELMPSEDDDEIMKYLWLKYGRVVIKVTSIHKGSEYIIILSDGQVMRFTADEVREMMASDQPQKPFKEGPAEWEWPENMGIYTVPKTPDHSDDESSKGDDPAQEDKPDDDDEEEQLAEKSESAELSGAGVSCRSCKKTLDKDEIDQIILNDIPLCAMCRCDNDKYYYRKEVELVIDKKKNEKKIVTLLSRIPDHTFPKCPYCLCVPDNPVFVCEQGHPMCKQCYQKDCTAKKKQNVICPICRRYKQLMDASAASLVFQNICFFCPNGCQKEMTLSDIKKHAPDCRPFTCIQCGFSAHRNDYEKHIKGRCPNDALKCKHCSATVMRKAMEGHLAECPEVEEEVPLGEWGVCKLKRKAAEPLQRVLVTDGADLAQLESSELAGAVSALLHIIHQPRPAPVHRLPAYAPTRKMIEQFNFSHSKRSFLIRELSRKSSDFSIFTYTSYLHYTDNARKQLTVQLSYFKKNDAFTLTSEKSFSSIPCTETEPVSFSICLYTMITPTAASDYEELKLNTIQLSDFQTGTRELKIEEDTDINLKFFCNELRKTLLHDGDSTTDYRIDIYAIY